MRTAKYSSERSYLADKCVRLRIRARNRSLEFDLTVEALVEIFNRQEGRCFYTGEILKLDAGTKRGSIAVDRVNNLLGYTNGNVVLCLNRINSIKDDVSLLEMQEWMPGWFGRVQGCPWLTCLPQEGSF